MSNEDHQNPTRDIRSSVNVLERYASSITVQDIYVCDLVQCLLRRDFVVGIYVASEISGVQIMDLDGGESFGAMMRLDSSIYHCWLWWLDRLHCAVFLVCSRPVFFY